MADDRQLIEDSGEEDDVDPYPDHPADDDGWRDFSEPTEDQYAEMDAALEDARLTQSASIEASPGDEDEEVEFVFDDKFKQKFEGLLYLGHLEAEVHTIPFHHFVVRTLTTGEKIKVTEITSQYEQSVNGYLRSYRAAVVAAGLVSIDGKPLLVAQRNVDAVRQKYDYVLDHWYDVVIEELYLKINELEGHVVRILDEMGAFEYRKSIAQAERSEVEVAGAN